MWNNIKTKIYYNDGDYKDSYWKKFEYREAKDKWRIIARCLAEENLDDEEKVYFKEEDGLLMFGYKSNPDKAFMIEDERPWRLLEETVLFKESFKNVEDFKVVEYSRLKYRLKKVVEDEENEWRSMSWNNRYEKW